jgi:neutral amino acid transport system permease protein
LSVPFVGPSYKIAVAFVLLLLVLLLRPRGLFGKAIVAR